METGVGIASRISWGQGVQIDLRGESCSIAVSPDQLARASSLRLLVEGERLGRVSEFIEQTNLVLPDGVPLAVITSAPVEPGSFYGLSRTLEAKNYLTIDVLYGEDFSSCFLRKCAELSLDERCCHFHNSGRDFFLTHPSARDLMRAYPVQVKRFYEDALLDYMKNCQQPGVMVDIGGNIGNHSIYAAALLGRDVVTFEPVAANYACLLKNIADNGLADKIRPIQMALGQVAGRARAVNLLATNCGAARLERASEGDIEVMRLDDYLPSFSAPVAIIKIDVEGMEADVLLGAKAVLEACSPVVFAESWGEAATQTLTAVMDGLGYRLKAEHCEKSMLEFVRASI